MNVLGPILIGLLLAAGVFAAIRFWHKRITRIVTVIAGLGIAWLAAYLIALSSVRCLGSCG
ncbi:TPA: hypothetical protein QDC27_006860 [Burkholderia cepacia ATCC 25416]|uniref:hypothetical protein n=1 Tax=Burkholderia cepacia TaxID=292 RepID=UPI001CF2BF12|nr:hypothetical protein [Burkholderia cepacia]HDR9768039.1 hypothetical protein [Burkholderia cepacia ATCC 25416]MCA8074530.1 hypothetical protein [Burkholderia cepacia]HDR9779002.1 hypothetical protein [Burkholderia cepacia ATCC 25416]HDR9781678.1 hypothetical protein [Burkholderia cepacia ATCC 25416]HDR9789456.1 hypothetical protein [Burkholderia cepacia ATCC 25416]